MNGYHFTSDSLRNGEPIPPIGEWLEYDGEIVPCYSGLHASEHPYDALQYAPGNLLHRVELEGELQSHGNPVDKWVGRRRRIIATIDAEPLLREFARWCALQVIHLWDAPPIVREYLETGAEEKRAAVREAAEKAAEAAAEAAAWVAAWVATGAAAWEAAETAAEEAAREAAGAAARAAARAAAKEAAEEAAREAAEAAAWATAREATGAAEAAAWERQGQQFGAMVDRAFTAAQAAERGE